jgi:hypothetical protein
MTRIILLATLLSVVGNAQAPFNKPLPKDQRIVHALHRLTFGPRPGDIEEVRRIGIEKWIAQQLQPASIAQNPALESRLKPLESLQMDTAAIQKEFPQANPLFARPPLLTEFLQPEQVGPSPERRPEGAARDPRYSRTRQAHQGSRHDPAGEPQ